MGIGIGMGIRRASVLRRARVAPALLILAVAGLLGVEGCASSGGGYPSGCASDLPRDRRSLDGVVDSAGLQTDVAGFWAPGMGRTVASIHYDSAGSLDTARVASATLREEGEDRLAAMVLAHARPEGAPGEDAYLFLGDEGGAALRRVPRLAGCAPRLLRRDLLARRLSEEAAALGVSRLVTANVMVHVQADGRAGEVRIARTSGSPEVDFAAMSVLRDATFTAGMLEGIPVALWAAFPLTFTPRR
ncbi:MAG: hypothetical protein AMXMBFR53_37490 [Gemmatimonadota bacterium]